MDNKDRSTVTPDESVSVTAILPLRPQLPLRSLEGSGGRVNCPQLTTACYYLPGCSESSRLFTPASQKSHKTDEQKIDHSDRLIHLSTHSNYTDLNDSANEPTFIFFLKIANRSVDS